jgi:hypothetical protein
VVSKPDENGWSIIVGVTIALAAICLSFIDTTMPQWFKALSAMTAGWLIAYPLSTRHLIVKELILRGHDPETTKKEWKISLGFIKL